MKKQKISTSVPACLSDFTAETNEMFSRAKLKVFYVGQTADKRLFTESFAKEIIKTLPYAPVVSHYDAEKDDFVGHAEQQNIYGIVDPLKEISFEEIDGQTWAVAEVVLYTERPDELGDIAKKIIGKPHSLELDPKTLQYKINYDKHRKLKNIEFTSGKFVGVSVLGSDQQPAFTGSAFFSVDTEFSKKMDLLKDYLKHSAEELSMEEQILNFVELSWGEKTKAIYKALDATYGVGNTYTVDIFDGSVVCYLWHEETCESELVRINYSLNDNGECTLGEATKVRIAYEEIVEASADASIDEDPKEEPKEDENVPEEEPKKEDCECDPEKEEPKKEDCECSESEEDKEEEDKEDYKCGDPEEKKEDAECGEPKEDEEEKKDDFVASEEPASEPQTDFSAEQDEPDADPVNEEGTDEPNASTFIESENEELKALERNEKLTLINSFASELGEEVLSKYNAEVDNYSKEELQISLLKEQINSMKSSAKKPMKAFKTINVNDKPQVKSLDELVRSYL